jgi:subtilase family serine protease
MKFYYLLLITFINYIKSNSQNNIPIYVALYQQNIELLETQLADISNPISINYGKWMSINEINTIISPSIEDQKTVLNWIYNYDVHKVKNYGDNIKFMAKPKIIIDMFNLSNLTNTEIDNFVGYSIPTHLRDVIEFVEMNSKPINRTLKINRKRLDDVTDDRYFGRESLISLYNAPIYSLNKSVSGGLVEYQNNEGFTNSDLNRLQIMNEQDINNITIIVGDNDGTDTESELDVQMMAQSADGIRLWYWESPYWLYSFAIDFHNTEDVPDIISMSWGWSEANQCDIVDCNNITSKQYVNRVNNEYLKIALRGKTIVVSSGDAGAPGRTNEECNLHHPINPTFPGSSPYVVSVGATYVTVDHKIKIHTTPLCRNKGCITNNDEKSIRFDSVGWTAGGGFNLYNNNTPFWQKQVVEEYLNSGIILPNTSNFNIKGRAYPDISAIGHSCPTYIDGGLEKVDGTSCSSPVVAGLLAIINDFLWTNHHIKLGFANPLLYYIYENCDDCFRDITDGYNWCTEASCCDNATQFGFNASKGYDPVSGLGTLNINNIVDFLKYNLYI